MIKAMIKNKLFQWIPLLLIAAIFAIGCFYGSYVKIVLASCSAMLFTVLRPYPDSRYVPCR